MGRRAGVITVDLTLGQAQFMTDIVKSKVAIQDFGRTTKSNMAESSAVVKVLEGNLGGTTRAVSRFLSVTLGLGPVLSAAFKVAGPVLLGKALYDVGEKIHEFFKSIEQAPEKVRQAFRDLNAPLDQTNASLDLTNAKLENQIAKLTGKRENTLKEALAEAVVEAGKLTQELDKSLKSLDALLKEESHNAFVQLFGASGAGKEAHGVIFEGTGGKQSIRSQVDEVNTLAEAKVAAALKAKDQTAAENAEVERQAALYRILTPLIGAANQKIGEAQKRGAPRTQVRRAGHGEPSQEFEVPGENPDTVMADINTWKGVVSWAEKQLEGMPKRAQEQALKSTLSKAEADKSARAIAEPFENAMRVLHEELVAARVELTQIGQSNEVKVMLQAALEADKALAKINQGRKEKGAGPLPRKDAASLESAALQGKQAKSIADTAKAFNEESVAAQEQLRVQGLLADAVGKGYEVVKRARVEEQLLGEIREHLNDPKYLATNAKFIEARRKEIALAYEAKQVAAGAGEEDRIRTQIELEAKLVQAEMQGAFAVRLATHEFALAEIAKNKDAESVRKLTAAEKDRFAVDTAKIEAASIKQTKDKITEVERLTAAQINGADAIHKAEMANKEAALNQQFGAGSTATKSAMAEEEALYQQKITEKAAARVNVYSNLLHDIEQERAKTVEIAKAGGDQLEVARALRELEDERLHTLSQQALAMRDAKDGLLAFFIDMQMSAKSSAEIVYGSLHSALDRVSDELANLFTGRKTNFKQMVGNLFHEATQESIKSGLQTGLGALGRKIFGVSLAKRDGNTEATALWVQFAGGAMMPGLLGAGGGGPGSIFGGSAGGGVFNFLGSMLGLGHRAAGGDVSPSAAYIVGERGPEILTGASGRVVSTAALSRASGGGGNHFYQIDARGTDPVLTEMRTRNAILAAHNSAVGTGFLVQQDHLRRSPSR